MATLPPTPTPTMATNHESTQPVCQNCQTSTTPLWRRDEMGSVLCNACGLFLKLHGRPRPISLKTDVIKSRNRVKTVRPDMQMKKKQSLPASGMDPNGLNMHAHDAATAAALAAVRRTSQHKMNGHPDDSPISRTGTPSMYDPNLAMYTNGVDGHQYQSPALPQYSMPTGGSPGHDPASANGEGHGDIPETREQLATLNASLKTRVSELEVINELYRGRLTQLEADSQNADNFRHQAEEALKSEARERHSREEIQRQLNDSHGREKSFKNKIDEMELELKKANDEVLELKQANEEMKRLRDDEPERPSKKPRLDEEMKTEESEAAPTPQSTA